MMGNTGTRSTESIFLLVIEAIIDNNAKLKSVSTLENEITIRLMCKDSNLYHSIIEPIYD